MSNPRAALLDRALDAMERLLRIFRVERYVYLFGAIAALLMTIYAAGQLFLGDSQVDQAVLLTFTGSGGLIAVCSWRAVHFFNKAFTIVEKLIAELSKPQGVGEDG